MSKALNGIAILAIAWAVLHGIWNIGNFEGFSGDLQGTQLLEGILALVVGAGLLALLLRPARR